MLKLLLSGVDSEAAYRYATCEVKERQRVSKLIGIEAAKKAVIIETRNTDASKIYKLKINPLDVPINLRGTALASGISKSATSDSLSSAQPSDLVHEPASVMLMKDFLTRTEVAKLYGLDVAIRAESISVKMPDGQIGHYLKIDTPETAPDFPDSNRVDSLERLFNQGGSICGVGSLDRSGMPRTHDGRPTNRHQRRRENRRHKGRS